MWKVSGSTDDSIFANRGPTIKYLWQNHNEAKNILQATSRVAEDGPSRADGALTTDKTSEAVHASKGDNIYRWLNIVYGLTAWVSNCPSRKPYGGRIKRCDRVLNSLSEVGLVYK